MNTHAQNSFAFQDEVPNFVQSNNAITSFSPQQSRVRVNQPNSMWMRQLKNRFDELTALPVGWDGYVGQPVSFTCANFAASLIERLCSTSIPTPSLVPGSDGSLQIEWHINQYDIEIDILAPYNVVATRFDHLLGKDEELELQSDFSILAIWIADLAIDRPLINQAEA